jgi:transposase InsO family protein
VLVADHAAAPKTPGLDGVVFVVEPQVMASRGPQRAYEHRLRDLVRQTGDPGIAVRVGVPRSTAAGWLKAPPPPVLTIRNIDAAEEALRIEVCRLQQRVLRLTVLVRVLFVGLRACHLDLARRRISSGKDKGLLLRAIDRAHQAMPLHKILRPIGLSPARFHSWKKAASACPLNDQLSCPKTSPQRLTADEIQTIGEMVTSEEYGHVPTGTLSVLAQRMGRVFASATTWYRLIRKNGWRRPRLRVHPHKPTVGIRATAPDQIWHIDTTIIRLVNGARAYLHAVIDNFSRKILAWKLAERFDPASTVAILLEAASSRETVGAQPTVIADAGVENQNRSVDELVESGLLRRVIAMAELHFSNSMIEAWWRTLKHQWLYLHCLDDSGKLEPLVRFYVEQHNSVLPHSAFKGETPDEMYFGTGDAIASQLQAQRANARKARLDANRAASCPECEPAGPSASDAA